MKALSITDNLPLLEPLHITADGYQTIGMRVQIKIAARTLDPKDDPGT